MKLTGKERTQLWLGVGILASGCALQIAHIYVLGLVLMLAGFAIYYPARRVMRQSESATTRSSHQPQVSWTSRLVVAGLVLLIVAGIPLMTAHLPPSAWPYALAPIVGAVLIFVVWGIMTK